MSYIDQNINSLNYENRFTNIKNYILHSLGYPLIRVELTNEHLILAIVEALTLYYKYAAVDEKFELVGGSGSNIIEIPTHINKSRIMDIIFPRSAYDTIGLGFDAPLDPQLGRQIFDLGNLVDSMISNFDITAYYMQLQKLEDFKAIFGTLPSWQIVNDKLHLYPSNAMYDQVGIVYKNIPGDDELDNEQWIKDYALAKSKHILGIIRSKISGFTTSGVNISADAEALKSEAKEEMTALKEDLKFSQRPLPIMQTN